MDLESLVLPYSPWRGTERQRDNWGKLVPDFRRTVFKSLVADLDAIQQMIAITGPRRVGKSTLLQQLVIHLLDRGVPTSNILYYSFDDPAIYRHGHSGEDIIESIMAWAVECESPVYVFLDEIQVLERWELYLKKYYDLKYPVRIVVSGSASSPIFKKSRESLLGRVKDYHVLPFSFREFLSYRLSTSLSVHVGELDELYEVGKVLMGMYAKSPEHVDTSSVDIPQLSEGLAKSARKALKSFVVDGGFPEVWKLPSAEKKIEYLFDNQVKKVIYEDLVLATEFRKPDQLKMFYVSLLERPGTEVSTTSLSQDIGISVQQIDKYLPLLEMTDLIKHAPKFRKSAVHVRKGNRKYYLVDLALRNAVMRLSEEEILNDESVLGLYAENLVFNALKKWRGILQVDYYRNRNYEIDFIVHTGPTRYWPVEVKYRKSWG
jgi:predicted AAA+ superfamily ATPase